MRKLATVERVTAVTPIPGADFIEAISVKGWTCVAKKGEFRVGDLGVYHEIDSVLPDREEYRFLWAPATERPSNFRLQSRRFKKVLSQGLMLPFGAVRLPPGVLTEGQDVTEALGIEKWDPPEIEDEAPVKGPPNRVKASPSTWPGLAPKTEEERVQNVRLENFQGRPYVITRKLDGTSATYGWGSSPAGTELVKRCERSKYAAVRVLGKAVRFVAKYLPTRPVFYSCSRNQAVSPDSTYGKIAEKYDIAYQLQASGRAHLVIQGEIVGPKIQKNPQGLAEPDFFVFNVFDQISQRYLPTLEALEVATSLGLRFVPILATGQSFDLDRETLLRFAEGRVALTGTEEEGIVVNFSDTVDGPAPGGKASFKVISNRFLLEKK